MSAPAAVCAHPSGDRGAGSVLALGIVGALAAALLVVAPLVGVVGAERRAANAADAAALAAADTASGLAAGIPCATAATLAAADGGRLERCVQQHDTVTVTVSSSAFGFAFPVSARAGPPDFAVTDGG